MEKHDPILIKPFLKWAGGKFKVLSDIKKKFPKYANRYFEPFLGAGAIALNVDYRENIVSDTNPALMLAWTTFKELGVKFIDECQSLFTPSTNKRKCFDELKAEFNVTKDKLRKATLFIYLNRHCFNGLCRFNSKGKFNVP